MRRVVIVTNSLAGGGAERSMNLVANKLSELDIEVYLLVINAGGLDLVAPKCSIISLNRPWRGGIFPTLKAFIRYQYTLSKIQPTHIILNCDLPELFGAFATTRAKIIGVAHIEIPFGNRRFLGRVVRLVLKIRGVNWVAVSTHLSIWPSQTIPNYVIENPIQVELVKTRKISENAINAKRIYFIGRLTQQKRPDIAIDVALRTGLPLLIFGNGELEMSLRKSVVDLNLRAKFLGFVPNPWENYKHGDILLIPSAFEGDGLVVLEALAHGVPFLLSDIPDFRRFELPDFIYCANVEEFVEKITHFETNFGDYRVPMEIGHNILSKRNIDRLSKKWIEVLSK
jgi:glycosyltransferase involved in cell wall biosynthesis